MIRPGLERISLLLKDTKFNWKAIHVAGTNGKGSICHIAAALLKRRTIRIGTFNSPHLINRWDCIKINGDPVSEDQFKQIENHFIKLNKIEDINASPFEILTATALSCFSRSKVKIGIVEVGMGGRLDATNILNNQCVSVISKIAKDHEAFLGSTLEEIAKHKAGILRPDVPYIVNPENEQWVQQVIDDYAKEIGAGPRLLLDTPELRKRLYSKQNWRRYALPKASWQRDNAACAIVAVKQAMKGFGSIDNDMIADELNKVRAQRNTGRLEYTQVVPVFGSAGKPGREILVDGAHNIDAAHVLDDWVTKQMRQKPERDPSHKRKSGFPVTWVIAMTAGRDAAAHLKVLLRPGDNIITTSFGPVDGMPWVQPVDSNELLKIAESVCPDITGLAMPHGTTPLRALCAAKYLTNSSSDAPIVLTGSLYLIGDLHRALRHPTSREGHMNNRRFWTSFMDYRDEQAAMLQMQAEEKERVERLLTLRDTNIPISEIETPLQKKEKINRNIENIEREMDLVKIEQQQVAGRTPKSPTPIEKIPWRSTDVLHSDGKTKTSEERKSERKLREESQMESDQRCLHVRPSFLKPWHEVVRDKAIDEFKFDQSTRPPPEVLRKGRVRPSFLHSKQPDGEGKVDEFKTAEVEVDAAESAGRSGFRIRKM